MIARVPFMVSVCVAMAAAVVPPTFGTHAGSKLRVRRPAVVVPPVSAPTTFGGGPGADGVKTAAPSPPPPSPATSEGRRKREPYFSGELKRVPLGHTTFEGVFDEEVLKHGLADLAADRDPAKSPKDLPEREATVEELTEQSQWHTVDPSGEEVAFILPDTIMRQIAADPKGYLRRLTSDMKQPDGDNEKDGGGGGGEAYENAHGDGGSEKDGAHRARGGAAAAILGADTRWHVTSATWRPAKQSGHLTMNGGSCSGALVGPRHVLTAAHCVHSGGSGGDWFGGYQFSPGRSQDGGLSPYGTYGWSRVTTFRGWTRNRDLDYDLAIITLSSDVTGGVGWLSFGYSGSMSSSWYVYHKGYSGDKAWGTQWSTSGSLSNVWSKRFYTDSTDTVGGNSGGPVYKYNGAGNAVIYGPHSGWNAYWFWWGAKRNRHTRITGSVFASMCDWIDDASVC